MNKIIGNFLPKYFYYDKIINSKYNIIGISILIQNINYLPINPQLMTINNINSISKKFNLNIELKKILINNIIINDSTNENDLRIIESSKQNYFEESYNIFKLHINYFLKYHKEEKKINILNKVKKYK